MHTFRSQVELERGVASVLTKRMPRTSFALGIADQRGDAYQLRLVVGESCPLHGRHEARRDDWPLPDAQRLPIRFRNHLLGELWVGRSIDGELHGDLDELLVHYATAVVGLTLHAESYAAAENYCASLQALEEGIVLFQEENPAAVTARLLSLASSMVQAAAGALYVLREVGRVGSGLHLEQALGIPEEMLATFRGLDGLAWPDVLLDQQAHVAVRAADGGAEGAARTMAMLDPDCVPTVLQSVVVLPLRYHGVLAGVCLLFNPASDSMQPRDLLGRLQSFGQLAAALLHRLSLEALTANSVSIARELEIAETIQKRLLPNSAPPTSDYEFAWSSIAAKKIGGDYIDVMVAESGDIHVVVADASGHGINSALLMTSFRANYRGNAPSSEPHESAGTLNDDVVQEVGPTGMFITAALLRLRPATRRLSLCSAGHNPTLIWRAASRALEVVDSHGPPLGFVPGAEYSSFETQLAEGDVLLLHTDGVTEATNDELDMFGDDRLRDLLRRHAADTSEQIVAAVSRALIQFTGRERQDDDVSMVVVKVR